MRKRVYRLHGRREVDHVEPALQIFRQRRIGEIDDQIAPLLAQIDADGTVRQVDYEAPFAARAAAEADIAQGVPLVVGFCFGKMRGDARSRGGWRGRLQRDEHGLAFELGVVADRFREIHDEPRAPAGLHNIHVAQVAIADFLRGLAKRVLGIGEVKRDSRRVVDREPRGRIGERLSQRDLDDDIAALLSGDADRFYSIALRSRALTPGRKARKQTRAHCQQHVLHRFHDFVRDFH